MAAIRVFVVDDHEVVRSGIVSMFDSNDQIRVVGQAGNARDALRLYRSLRPDITLMDIRLPGDDGFATLNGIRSSDPTARVIILATDAFEADILFARKAGACGYLTKTIGRKKLLSEILQAFTTGTCSPFAPSQDHAAPAPASPPLTERELDVLRHMRRGLNNADIGKALDISEHTVKSHVASILKNLHAASRAEAVAIGFDLGLLRTNHGDTTSSLFNKLT
ncbi:MAG TPA: response regulator transcription factor [Verrucomicrobiae bacterium]|nr:response regulator transcription factor [Verrucomicrobiae bacterium]